MRSAGDIRAWLADPNNGAAADAVEAESAGGRAHADTLRRDDAERRACRQCTSAKRHGDGQLPDHARRRPKDVQAELQAMAGPKVEVKPDPNYIGESDAGIAVTARHIWRGLQGDPVALRPVDGRLSRHVDGRERWQFLPRQGHSRLRCRWEWGISPIDERAHGLDERIPVNAMYNDVIYWTMIYRDLAG